MGDMERNPVNAEEARIWNTGVGLNWVEFQDELDRLAAAVNRRLLERARPMAGERVLDIGCGAGATTLAVAALVGAEGSVVGVDISRPLLDAARKRSNGMRNVAHHDGDAQTYAFEGAAFDLLISRFGVMFFEDPVAAFRNMARAMRPGARVVFAVWAKISDNPWFSIPRDAAVARLGAAPPAPPDAPGPFAFADIGRVTEILHAAGFGECKGVEETVELTAGRLEEAARLAGAVGPASRLMKLRDGTEEDARAIAAEVARGFAGFVVEGTVRIPARLNFFEAKWP